MESGRYPTDGCRWCYRLIVRPASRERHGGYASTDHRSGYTINLDETTSWPLKNGIERLARPILPGMASVETWPASVATTD